MERRGRRGREERERGEGGEKREGGMASFLRSPTGLHLPFINNPIGVLDILSKLEFSYVIASLIPRLLYGCLGMRLHATSNETQDLLCLQALALQMPFHLSNWRRNKMRTVDLVSPHSLTSGAHSQAKQKSLGMRLLLLMLANIPGHQQLPWDGEWGSGLGYAGEV